MALRVKRARVLGRRCPRGHGPLARLRLGRLGRAWFSAHVASVYFEDSDWASGLTFSIRCLPTLIRWHSTVAFIGVFTGRVGCWAGHFRLRFITTSMRTPLASKRCLIAVATPSGFWRNCVKPRATSSELGASGGGVFTTNEIHQWVDFLGAVAANGLHEKAEGG